MKKIKVNYLGVQDCENIMPSFILINVPRGNGEDTIAFKPNKHKINLNNNFDERIFRELGKYYFKKINFIGI
jgi:hypothetical protein